MFSNSEGTSHKRVLGTVGFISLVAFMWFAPSEHKAIAVDAVEYITIAAIFGTVVEKFSGKNTTVDKQE